MLTSSRPTILLVDDNPDNLEVLSSLLQPFYAVLAANSGESALRVAGLSPKPDLILLDIMMPGLDGYGVLARLRANPLTRDIPVIFVTALSESVDEQRGLELGAADYIIAAGRGQHFDPDMKDEFMAGLPTLSPLLKTTAAAQTTRCRTSPSNRE